MPSAPRAIFIDCKSVSILFHSFSFEACSALSSAQLSPHTHTDSEAHTWSLKFPDSKQFHVSCHHYILSNDKLCINQLSKFWLYADREKTSERANDRASEPKKCIAFFPFRLRHVNCVRAHSNMYSLHMVVIPTISVAIVTMQTSMDYTYAAAAPAAPAALATVFCISPALSFSHEHTHTGLDHFAGIFSAFISAHKCAFISHANKRQSHSTEQRTTTTTTAKSSKRESNVNTFFVYCFFFASR